MQLVEDGVVTLLDTMKNKRLGSAEVMEKFGVPPSKVVEVQALAGDSTDNVPGVRGIGVKTAAELINQYGDLETLLKRAGEIKQPKRRETLIENTENARISLKLVTLDQNAPIKEGVESFGVREPEAAPLIGFLKAMEFNSLTRRAASHFGIENPDLITADTVAAPSVKPSRRTATRSIRPCRRRAGRGHGSWPADEGDRSRRLRDRDDDHAAVRMDRAGAGDARGCRRYRNDIARSNAGGALRRVAGGGAGRGLLHPVRASRGRRSRCPTATPSCRSRRKT